MPGIFIGNVIGNRRGGGTVAPAAPTLLTASVYSDTEIDLSWTNNNSGDNDGFKVYISTDNSTFTLKDTVVNPSAVFYFVSGLTANTLYYFKVVSYKNSLLSDFSNTDSETTLETWYLTGGISAANVLGVWSGVGAASKAASLVNLANPGTDDLTEQGTVVWSKSEGWYAFENSKYLKGPTYKSNTYSVIVLFGGARTNNTYGRAFSCEPDATGTKGTFIIPVSDATVGAIMQANMYTLPAKAENGVIGATQSKFVVNGVTIDNVVPTGVEVSQIFQIGYGGNQWFRGSVQAVVVYKTSITEAQMIGVQNRMKDGNFLIKKRDFTSLTKYASNPIIVHGTETWNSFGTAPTGISIANKIGNNYYGLCQASTAANVWNNLALYKTTDLIAWTVEGTNPVIAKQTNAWDHSYLLHPCIIKVGSEYRAYYSASDNANKHTIGFATSPDLINWTKYGSNPVYSTAGNVSVPWVILIGSTYYLYYWNRLTGDNGSIDYATSSDGITWTYVGAALPRITAEWDYSYSVLDPCVIRNRRGYYEMVYTIYKDTTTTDQKIGYAVSRDGVNWYKHYGFILQKGSTWEAGYVGDPILLEKEDGTIYLYYSGMENNVIPSNTASDGGVAIL